MSPTPWTRANRRRDVAVVRPEGSLRRGAATVYRTILALAAAAVSVGLGPAVRADGQVTPVSYTTGKTGHQLKWLPVRPAEPGVVRQAVATEDVQTPSAGRPAGPVLAAPTDAFADPFGDSKKAAGPTPSAKGTPAAAAKKPSSEESKFVLPPPETTAQPGELPKELAGGPYRKPDCPTPGHKDDEYFKSILDRVPPPKVKAEDELPIVCKALGERPYDDRLDWPRTTFMWKASALCHKPAYFEDESLERYGHTCGPWLQPVVSGGHFFLTVPILPYIMGLYPPNECVYTLGYYRPGSCAPHTIDPLPLSIRAVLAEGAVWTGMVFVIP